MKGERLELVKDFGELRAGMIVVYTPCAICGQTHRAMLGNRKAASPCVKGDTFETFTAIGCMGGAILLLCPCSVVRRALYRVVDGLESSTTETRVRAKPAIKARP